MKQLPFLKCINTSNTKRIHCNVHLKAHCEWGKVQNVNFFKINNLKNIVHGYLISSVSVAPVKVHNWAKYEGSKLNHVVKSHKNKLAKMAAI